MLLLLRFYVFFENPKKRDFTFFFALLHTFSGTMFVVKQHCADWHLSSRCKPAELVFIVSDFG